MFQHMPLLYLFIFFALWLRFQWGRKTDGRNRGRAESGWSHSPAVPCLWLATQPLWSHRPDQPVPLPAGRTNKLTSGSVRTFPVRRHSCKELAVVMGEEFGQGMMLKDVFFYHWLSSWQVAQLVNAGYLQWLFVASNLWFSASRSKELIIEFCGGMTENHQEAFWAKNVAVALKIELLHLMTKTYKNSCF